MAKSFDQLAPKEALVAIGRDFHQRGWMAGTAGNLSVRSPSSRNQCWISASGLPKGRMESSDIILLDINSGEVIQRLSPDAKPSAETSIHQVIYQCVPDANACLHIHTIDACIATERAGEKSTELPLPPLEMIKGLGVWEQAPSTSLPLFDNILDVSLIAAEIKQRFQQDAPKIPALMIKHHGITVWGKSLQEAYNRVEIIEFIMSYLARR